MDKSLPAELTEFLAARQLRLVRPYFVNLGKQQATAQVLTDSGADLLLKYRWGDGEPLQREIDFYQTSSDSFSFVPGYVDSGEDFLLLEHYPATTLRSFLSDSPSGEALQTVLLGIRSFLSELYPPASTHVDAADRTALLGRYRNLLSSKQQGLSRSSFETFFFRTFALASTPLLSALIPVREDAPKSLAHGDLHLNNVLVLDDLTVKVIDWERTATASPQVDLLYFLAMLNKKLPVALRFWGDELIAPELRKFATAMYWAVRTNRAF